MSRNQQESYIKTDDQAKSIDKNRALDKSGNTDIHLESERMLMTRLRKKMTGLLKPGKQDSSSTKSLLETLMNCCTEFERRTRERFKD